ncbi:tetratricopeptide repeat protein [soil metagenome]|nr:tetratricopeptide repeat protein [Trueperaceae bacterium]
MTDRPTIEGTETAAPAGDWRTMLIRGRYDLAAQTYRLTGGDDDVLRSNLEALSDAQLAARDKGWRTVAKALERVDERHSTLPWAAIDADVEALREASLALDAREPEQAREHLQRVDGSGFPAETATLMGTLAIFEGEPAQARERFEAALELDPNHYRALTNLGNLKLEEGDVDGAIEAYERAIRLNDGFANAHHNLGVAYRRKGQVAKSVSALRRAQREGNRRDAEDARSRFGSKGGRRAGNPQLVRWIVIAAAIAVAYWYFAVRTP